MPDVLAISLFVHLVCNKMCFTFSFHWLINYLRKCYRFFLGYLHRIMRLSSSTSATAGPLHFRGSIFAGRMCNQRISSDFLYCTSGFLGWHQKTRTLSERVPGAGLMRDGERVFAWFAARKCWFHCRLEQETDIGLHGLHAKATSL